MGFYKPLQYKMNVLSVHELTGDVFHITLKSVENKSIQFHAGQYLMLHRQGLPESAYSIASPPCTERETIELHVQSYPGSARSIELIRFLKTASVVTVTLPFGQCTLSSSNTPASPLVFIAAATGFSQIKSLIEYSSLVCHHHPRYFYWGAKQPQGFYMGHLPVQWASEEQCFEYHPVISGDKDEGVWNGRFGLLYEAVLEDCKKFSSAHFYIGGSPTMVYATIDALVAEGFSENVMHSDVFEYAPR